MLVSWAASSLGAFVPEFPLFIGFLPMVGALYCGDVHDRWALIAGHYGVGMFVAVYGLFNLGVSLGILVPVFVFVWLGVSWLCVKVGVGIFTVVTALLVFFPDNLLHVAGSLFPMTSLLGIALFTAWLLLMDMSRRLDHKVKFSVGFCRAPNPSYGC